MEFRTVSKWCNREWVKQVHLLESLLISTSENFFSMWKGILYILKVRDMEFGTVSKWCIREWVKQIHLFESLLISTSENFFSMWKGILYILKVSDMHESEIVFSG